MKKNESILQSEMWVVDRMTALPHHADSHEAEEPPAQRLQRVNSLEWVFVSLSDRIEPEWHSACCTLS